MLTDTTCFIGYAFDSKKEIVNAVLRMFW